MSDPPSSFSSSSIVGRYWPGFASLKHLVIFGDSYSSLGDLPADPRPSLENPLGVKFPGHTWAGGDGDSPNWVGYLVSSRIEASNPLLVYDYAIGGHTVRDVRGQVYRQFLPNVGEKPDWAPWRDNDTLFATWIGINNCAYTGQHVQTLKLLFDMQESLYKAGARNFMFIDVPPIQRSPAVPQSRRSDPGIAERYENWNTSLHLYTEEFYSAHPDVTILKYSSWALFNRILDNPSMHGFFPSDVDKAGGRIWMDHLHPTTDVHRLIAHDVETFLVNLPAFVEPVDDGKE